MPGPNAPKLDIYRMPFTAKRQCKVAPRLLIAAEGMHYTSADGQNIVDGTADLWCCNAGHGWRSIGAAVERQLASLDYAPSFQVGGHLIAFEFAERPGKLRPVVWTAASIG